MSDKERFEAWAKAEGLSIKEIYGCTPDDPAYNEYTTFIAWEAWQAAQHPAEPTPEMVSVPREPTEEMWSGLARDLIMAWEMFGPNVEGTREHLSLIGYKELPAWLEKELSNKVHLAKGDRAVLFYKAMIAAGESK